MTQANAKVWLDPKACYLSILIASSDLLELEFVYLPLGLPDGSSSHYWKLLEELAERAGGDGSMTSSRITDRQQFDRLRDICEAARLSGDVSALEIKSDYCRPFQLERVGMEDLRGGACPLVLQHTTSVEASSTFRRADSRGYLDLPPTTSKRIWQQQSTN